ncbi:MAG: preprotein translocase subunit Tim44 [Caulobacter sp.]|nr:preprotein translocase subunit Tim44 [Caulobacter sp.]
MGAVVSGPRADKIVLQLIIFAVLAAIVLYQLYSTLGRRVGRQPDEAPAPLVSGPPTARDQAEDQATAKLPGLAALRARQPDFDVGHFLSGARGAYEMIVRAFAAGDRDALKPLLSDSVMANFETAMTAREAEGRTETVEFLVPPRADLDAASVQDDIARAVVRILAEVRTRSSSPEGDAVDDRRTAELWTFERSLKSGNPNWTLVHVGAAAA